MENYLARLVDWIREKVSEAGFRGVTFGMSGGLDSSVLAALCKRAYPDDSLGLIMPCYSHPKDEEHALLAAETFNLYYEVIVLDDVFDLMMSKFDPGSSYKHSDLAAANLKARLRMVCLYYHAAKNRYLVAGSSNRSELEVGYFTKYGDNGVDIMPLADLVKGQVREIAKILGIPAEIIEKPPSGGLWPGQTDEEEMGITYEQLDRYLLKNEGEEKVIDLIDSMIKGSAHKKKMPSV
ncbi:MAG: NAD(+) synthase, partial [Firmicutes bacterium HGW-Firmicutes-13]